MFIHFVTTKGEKVVINMNKILFINEEKKRVLVFLEDGTMLSVTDDFETVCQRLFRRDSLCAYP